MTPEAYIQSQLDELRTLPAPQKAYTPESLYELLMSKKFRKYASTKEQQENIKTILAQAVENKAPIKISFPFGAYKLWRFDEAPEPDWAELFALMYYAKWMLPLAQLHAPGVVFDFVSDAVIVERMNNISKADTDAYDMHFRKLCEYMQQYLPLNMRFTLTTVASLYDSPADFERALEKEIASRLREQGGAYRTLPPEEKKMIELNVRLREGQGADPLWREKVDLLHYAYYAVAERRPYLRDPKKITAFPLLLPGFPTCVAVGTTKTSVAKFWAGVGALVPHKDRFEQQYFRPSKKRRRYTIWFQLELLVSKGRIFHKCVLYIRKYGTWI